MEPMEFEGKTVEEAIDTELRRVGNEPRVGVLTHGGVILPLISNTQSR